MQVSSGPSFPITNYLAPVLTGGNVGANGTVLKTAGTSAGVMQLPGGFTFMPGTREPRPWGRDLQGAELGFWPPLSASGVLTSFSGRLCVFVVFFSVIGLIRIQIVPFRPAQRQRLIGTKPPVWGRGGGVINVHN